jgi:hypothetical protein
MKNIVHGIFSFSCNECSYRHDIPDEFAEFHQLDADEISEDAEHKYGWNHSVKCVCGQTIDIDYVIWEYPAGEFSNAEIDIDGGTLIDEFTYDLKEEAKEDAFDDDEGDLEW